MNLFDMAKAATTVMHLGNLAANAAKVLTDPQSTDAEKKDASKAKKLADKKMSDKNPSKMYSGGMANGKQHMYLNDGGLVTDNLNPGLKALAKKRPDVVKKILKKS